MNEKVTPLTLCMSLFSRSLRLSRQKIFLLVSRHGMISRMTPFSFIRIDKEKIRSFVNVFEQASGKKIYDCKFNVEKLLAIEEQRLILGAPFGNSMVVATFANVP